MDSSSFPLAPIILQHSVNLLAGAPGTGKTAFLAGWVKWIQDRQPIFTLPPSPVDIYQAFIGADRSWDQSTRLWFEAVQLDFNRFPHYSLQDDRKFQKSRLRKKHDRIAIFRECLDHVSPNGDGAFPHPSIIYVDPLALFLGGNLLDYDACLVACSELREICIDRGVTIIGSAHAGKQKADKKESYLRLQDRILGSAALFGYTDTQLYLASPEETGQDTYTFLWCPHHAKSQMFQLRRRDSDGLFELADTTPAPAKVLTDVDWLLEALSHPREFATLCEGAEAHGMSRMTLSRRLRELLNQGRIAKVSRGTYVTTTVN